ncbi:S24 family peptidase [Nocardioides sp.]|uniref:S24 family peptidase n=1 Tax=Nocardioides sp. TaxID=35761 RepID=UPI003517DFCC
MSDPESTRPAEPGPSAPLGFVEVVGRSMEPALRAGDRLLVAYGRTPRPGQVVLARFADGTVVVKRVAERRERGWWLLSDNAAEGVDSRHRGAVGDADVLAVALGRWWPRPSLVL